MTAGKQRETASAVMADCSRDRSSAGGDVLSSWAEKLTSRAGKRARGVRRFAFYGRVSTEDWQDPVTSRARQLQQALMLAAGAGVIVAEFFDTGESRELPWARRPQAAALVAQLADPERGWDAVVIGEYERAFDGNQYASMAPLLEHYGVSLWMPEVGGQVDWHAEDHEETMAALGLSSKREITRTRVRVRTALVSEADFIAAQDAAVTRGPAGPAARRYLLAGLLACGRCGRRLEPTWSNGKPAYRSRHGYTSATRPRPGRPGNTYVREEQILPH